jgi:hypothetical protein
MFLFGTSTATATTFIAKRALELIVLCLALAAFLRTFGDPDPTESFDVPRPAYTFEEAP